MKTSEHWGTLCLSFPYREIWPRCQLLFSTNYTCIYFLRTSVSYTLPKKSPGILDCYVDKKNCKPYVQPAITKQLFNRRIYVEITVLLGECIVNSTPSAKYNLVSIPTPWWGGNHFSRNQNTLIFQAPEQEYIQITGI